MPGKWHYRLLPLAYHDILSGGDYIPFKEDKILVRHTPRPGGPEKRI
jgi:hypothetical protein